MKNTWKASQNNGLQMGKEPQMKFTVAILIEVIKMTTGQTIQTLFEIVFGGFIIWGLLNKDTLDKIEDEIMLKVQKKLNTMV